MNPDIHETIDAYLRNTLSADERARFEQAMAADEELAAEVAIFQLEQEGQELLIERDLRDKMHRWKTGTTLPQRPSGRRRWWWFVGVGLLCFSGLLWYLAQPATEISPAKPARPTPARPKTPSFPTESAPVPVAKTKTPSLPAKTDRSLRALALAAYDRPDFSDTFRRTDTTKNANQDLQRVLDAWVGAQPNAVIEAAASVPVGDPNYFRVQEILAHTWLADGQYGRAREVFDRIVAADLGAASENAEWYGLLCLLAEAKTDAARNRLNRLLADHQHIRHEDAKRLKSAWMLKTK